MKFGKYSLLITILIFFTIVLFTAGCIDEPENLPIIPPPSPTLIFDGQYVPSPGLWIKEFVPEMLLFWSITEGWNFSIDEMQNISSRFEQRFKDSYDPEDDYYKVYESEFYDEIQKNVGMDNVEYESFLENVSREKMRAYHNPPVMAKGWIYGSYGTAPGSSENQKLYEWIAPRIEELASGNSIQYLNITDWIVAEDGSIILHIEGPMYPSPEDKEKLYQDLKAEALKDGISDVPIHFGFSGYEGWIEIILDFPMRMVGASGTSPTLSINGTITPTEGKIIASAEAKSFAEGTFVTTPILNYTGHLCDVPVSYEDNMIIISVTDLSGNVYDKTLQVLVFDRDKYPDFFL